MLPLLRDREAAPGSRLAAQRDVAAHRGLVERLRMTQRLRCHQGCVNHVSFNEEGMCLCSACLRCVRWEAVR